MAWMIKSFLKSLLLPPGSLICLFALAWILSFKKKWLGRVICLVSFLALYGLSTPKISYETLHLLEEDVKPLGRIPKGVGAIIILGGGQRREAPELGSQDGVSSHTLMRLAYGASLHRKTGLPILVSGGVGGFDTISEARLMTESLRNDFALPAHWTEDLSRNTAENAEYSSDILKKAGVNRALVVTEAWHMRRAMLAFSITGIEAIPAPTFFESPLKDNLFFQWLPRAECLFKSAFAIHEWVGLLWYRLIL